MSVTFFVNSNDDGNDINVSNANFASIANALGILGRFPDYCGSINATELRDICQAWQGKLEFDAGVELSKDGIIIDCGRARGYLNVKVQQLLELAELGIELGKDINFG